MIQDLKGFQKPEFLIQKLIFETNIKIVFFFVTLSLFIRKQKKQIFIFSISSISVFQDMSIVSYKQILGGRSNWDKIYLIGR